MRTFDREQPYLFISYTKIDKDLVYPFVERLRENGANVWMDDLLGRRAGSWVTDVLPLVVDENRVLTLYFRSKSSLVNKNVYQEIEKSIRVNGDKSVHIVDLYPHHNNANVYTELYKQRDTIEIFTKMIQYIDEEANAYLYNDESDFSELLEYLKAAGVIIQDKAIALEEKVIGKAEEVPQQVAISNGMTENESTEKIGAFVQKSLTSIIEEELLSTDLIAKMQDVEWSKEVLNLNYPLLLKLVQGEDVNKQREDAKGRARYWATPYLILGEQYFVCNDWYEKDRKYWDDFLVRLKEGDTFELSSEKKKVFSVTGDVTYVLYGKEYTENQADMMLRVFAQVLNRHQDKVDTLPEQDGMNCAAKYEDIEKPGTSAAKPTYFRSCNNFTFDNGSEVCIGTAYSSGDKMKKIAKLLEICGEDRSVFYSEQLELPEAGRSRASGSGVEYTFYGQQYTGDQTEMMCHVCSTVISKHPDKLAELVENTLCIGFNDASINGKTYFRVSRVYNAGNREYRVGTSFGMDDKLKQIAKVFAICGEGEEILVVKDHEFVVKNTKRKTANAKKDFFA